METKALNEKTLLEERDELMKVYEDIRTDRLLCGEHKGFHMLNLEAKINGLNKLLFGETTYPMAGMAAYAYVDYLKGA
jgi:hypothetical protein